MSMNSVFTQIGVILLYVLVGLIILSGTGEEMMSGSAIQEACLCKNGK